MEKFTTDGVKPKYGVIQLDPFPSISDSKQQPKRLSNKTLTQDSFFQLEEPGLRQDETKPKEERKESKSPLRRLTRFMSRVFLKE